MGAMNPGAEPLLSPSLPQWDSRSGPTSLPMPQPGQAERGGVGHPQGTVQRRSSYRNSPPQSGCLLTGVSAGGSNVENFKIGQDVIAVTNYQNSGDNLFVGSAAAAASINAVTAGEALLASTNGWSWMLDLNSTTSGTLAYVGAIGASPTNANLSIHLIGVQGTIAGVDSFFYQG